MIAFEAERSQVIPISPCTVSVPAQGLPVWSAVILATVAELLIPDAFGFATNSSGGFESFSKTFQVQFAPCPDVSKSIGSVRL